MTVWITEYAGPVSGRTALIAQEPAIQTQLASSTAAIVLSAGTRLVRVAADVGIYILFNSSTSAVNASSTANSGRIAANAAGELRGVSPYARVTMLST